MNAWRFDALLLHCKMSWRGQFENKPSEVRNRETLFKGNIEHLLVVLFQMEK